MSGLLQIGASGLAATQSAMEVTAGNIANANTPFYSRRQAIFSEAFYGSTGDGVFVSDVLRLTDAYADKNAYNCTSNFALSSTYFEKTSYLESILDGDGDNIATKLNGVFKNLEAVNINPSSINSRNIYLSTLNQLVSSFALVTNDLYLEQATVNSVFNDDVVLVNQITTQIAAINSQISALSSDAQAPLLDERDKLITELSAYVDVFTNNRDNGVVDVMLSNGTSLVASDQSFAMSVVASTTVSGQFDIYVAANQINVDVTSLITGGQLGGLLNYQRGPLDQSQRSLAQLELVLNQQFNSQNELGMDLNGSLGGLIFNDINSTTAISQRYNAYTTNAGSAALTVSIDDATQLTTSNYSLVFTSTTDYQLTRLSDSTLVTSGTIASLPATISADGFEITVPSGASFVAGDGFNISPTNINAAALSLNITDSSLLALALPVVVSSSSYNQGSGQIELTSIVDTTNTAFSIPMALDPPILVQFVSANTYQLVNANDSTTVIESGLSYDATTGVSLFPTTGGYDPGYRVFLSGTVDSGDQFNIAYNTNGVGDNRNGLLFASLMQEGSVDNDTLTYTQAYRQLSGNVSLQVNSARSSYDSDKILKIQADTRKDQVSGVSLEEESIYLTQLQQAYQANAQLIEAAQKMFDVLILSISRR